MRIWLSSGMLALTIATGCMPQGQRDVIDQTYVHKYGVEVPPDYWSSAGKEGSVISTMANGTIVMNTFSNGILHGESTYTFPHNERLERKEIYQNGQLEKETVFYHDGTPKQETYYVLSSPLKYVTTWYTTSTPKSYETYEGNHLVNGEYYTLDNQRDSFVENFEGSRIQRDDYGQMISRDTIEEGNLILSTTYHPNGAPKEMIPFVGGKIEGVKKTFFPGGEPNTLEEWKSGIQEGITTIFQNGEKFSEVPYVNGQRNGIERRYKDEKVLVKEVMWINGEMHGPAKTYVNNSVKTEWFFQGEATTKNNFDALVTRQNSRK